MHERAARTGASGQAAPPAVAMISLGCAKNTVDSERVLGMLAECGFAVAADPRRADVVLVNTCAFIAPARSETERTLRALSGRRPVVAIGCYSERMRPCGGSPVYRDPAFPKVAAFVGFGAFDELPAICARLAGRRRASPFLRGGPARARFAESPRLRAEGAPSAFLKIAEGCSNRCSYCAVPGIRGPLRSLPIGRLVEEAERLAEIGAREICVVAQDTGSYGLDRSGRARLAELLRRLCAIRKLRWVRLLYMHPAHLTDEIVEVLAGERKMCRYLDLPIQHASDRILAAMGRGYDSSRLRSLVERLRERVPGIALRTSVIAGFPGETEREFQELLGFVREARFDHLGAFAYSPEEGTPAAALQGRSSPSVAAARRRRIMREQQRIAFEILRSRVGSTETAMLESCEGGIWRARTAREAPDVDGHVLVGRCGGLSAGRFVRVRLLARRGYDLVARLLAEAGG